MFRSVSTLVAAALSLAAAQPAAAAVLIVESGILTGAKGVTVGTATYDVEFLDGSCVTLFSNCAADPSSSPLPAFAFTTEAGAAAASQALLDLVFIDTAAGAFDSRPELTQGCISLNLCAAFTPFLLPRPGDVTFYVAHNIAASITGPPGGANPGTLATPLDLTFIGYATYARWEEVPPIPLPASLPLLLAGLGGLAVLRKRRSRA